MSVEAKRAAAKPSWPGLRGRRKARAPRERSPSLWSRLRQHARPPPRSDVAILAGYRRDLLPPVARLALFVLLAVIAVGWGFWFGVSAPFRTLQFVAPIPVMALLMVWMLPQGEYAPTRAIEPLFFAFCAGMLIWPDYLAITLPHLPWISMRRLTGTPLVLIVLICTSVSADFRGLLRRRMESAPLIWKLLVAFLVLQTISVALSSAPGRSVNLYISTQLDCTAMFFASLYVFSIPGALMRWARLYLAAAIVICAIGVWEGQLGVLPWGDYIPSFLRVEYTDRISAGVTRATIGIHRVQSVYTHPIALAELLALGAPFALHLAFSRGPMVTRVLAFAYLPLGFYVVSLTDSRLGMGGLLASALLYLFFWSLLRWRAHARGLLAPALVLSYPMVFVGAIAATFVVGPLRRAIWGGGGQQSSTGARMIQWHIALPKVATHPLGHGLGEAGGVVGFLNPQGQITLDSAWINTLITYGPLGFVFFYGMFLVGALLSARLVVKSPQAGDLSVALPISISLGIFVLERSVFNQDQNIPLAYMMLGAVCAMVYRAQAGEGLGAHRGSTPSMTAR